MGISKLLETWKKNDEKLKTPSKRIPPLNIIGVITLNVVHREWESILSHNEINKAKSLVTEITKIAMKAQREALTLLPNTEWEEEYDFDMYYDLARMQCVKCRIMKEAKMNHANSECLEALKNMEIAKRKASSIQLNAARQAMVTDPILSKVPMPHKNELAALLESSEI